MSAQYICSHSVQRKLSCPDAVLNIKRCIDKSALMLRNLQEERDSFSKHLIGGGFTDVWRNRHPDIVGYTYFSYKLKDRQDNKGWRLDYFLVSSPNLQTCTCD